MKRMIDALITFILAVVLWQLVVWLSDVPHFILPGPVSVWNAFLFNFELIIEHAQITIAEVLIGLVIGSALGMATALHLMTSATIRRFILPVMVFSQAVPVFALAPILTLWLGYGIGSKIVMAILIIYFPVASNFYDGLNRTNPGLLDLAKTMGASNIHTIFRLRLPAALPSLGSGLRLAAVYAPIGAVIGEWVGSSKGLGYLMLLANGRAKIDLMFATLFVLALFTVGLHAVVGQISKRLSDWAE
jgi:putative hydroxymethylpyrimidine transport system permease protein